MTNPILATPLLKVSAAGLTSIRSGKVREVFEVDGHLALVATDRVSAFDVVMNEGVPWKGAVLNHVSEFWFRRLADRVPNHLITTDIDQMPEALRVHRDLLAGRTMLCKKCEPLPVEFVVRGYLAGSGLKEYRETGSICGVALPPGLVESSKLPQPILTPTTKADVGHDEAIDFDGVVDRIGHELAIQARDISLEIFRHASDYAAERGLLLADTKFEFGVRDGVLHWIDEALTPDSSRYWSQANYRAGERQEAWDKQVLRDHLLDIGWNRQPPPPTLTPEIIRETSSRYLESARILTGSKPAGAPA